MAAQTSGCQLREEMPELDKTGADKLS